MSRTRCSGTMRRRADVAPWTPDQQAPHRLRARELRAAWSLRSADRSGYRRCLRAKRAAVDDDAAVDRDAIGFLAERFSGGRGQLGLHTGRPAQPAKFVPRLGDLHVLRIGLGDKDLVQPFANHRRTSGGCSSGGGSAGLARMKSGSGSGERLSARPQAASVSAMPAVAIKEIALRRIRRSYPGALRDCERGLLENSVCHT